LTPAASFPTGEFLEGDEVMKAWQSFFLWGAICSVARGADAADDAALCRGRTGALHSAAWSVHRVGRWGVLNSAAPVARDADPRTLAFGSAGARLCGAGSREGDCRPGGPLANVITNGTFHDGAGGVLGPTMRHGHVDVLIEPNSKIYGRGGLAIFEDGSAALCRPGASGAVLNGGALTATCARGSQRLYEFIGGGALLIHQGRKVCSDGQGAVGCDASADLYRVQRFDQGGRGLAAGQMRATNHTVVAERGGRLYVLWNKVPKSGATMQNELCAAGFEGALKFDGGSGFFARVEGAARFGAGRNPTGLLVATDD
jgi:hypothetical protein